MGCSKTSKRAESSSRGAWADLSELKYSSLMGEAREMPAVSEERMGKTREISSPRWKEMDAEDWTAVRMASRGVELGRGLIKAL